MRISKVYTKTGDQGDTGLVGNVRVPKDDPRVEAYGTVDELSSLLGWVRSELQRTPNNNQAAIGLLDRHLDFLQHQLFDLGSILATRNEDRGPGTPTLGDTAAGYLESLIDAYNADLGPLKDFVLPGGNAAVAAVHVARCVARRAERRVYTLHRVEPLECGEIVYLNRLSDLLFVLARWVARTTNASENLWRKNPEPPPLPQRIGQ